MSGLPSDIRVLRHVPVHLVEGFHCGEYRLWGGVLRRAVGEGRGQIVGFLTEGRELARRVEQGLPIDAEALRAAVGSTRMASQMALGIGVLNLGVQVAGFAAVLRRLDRISGQIRTVHRDLQAMGEKVEWLEMGMMADLRTGAASALATAERAVRQNDRALLNQARMQGDRARRYLTDLSSGMLLTDRAITQQALFERFMQAAVLLAYAEAQCDEAVEGAEQAARDLAVAVVELRRLSDAFREQVRDFSVRPLALLKVGDAGRTDMKALATRIEDLVDRLEGYVPQLEVQHAQGLNAKEWRDLLAAKGGGTINCIAFDGKTDDRERAAEGP